MLNVLLLGVIHDYQELSDPRGHPLSPASFESLLAPGEIGSLLLRDPIGSLYSQRRYYAAWVRACVRDFQPRLIFDEMNFAESQLEERLDDTDVLWVYMDIPQGVRERFSLTCERGPGTFWVDAIDTPREQHWQLVIESITTACKVTRVVVICGLAHLDTFSTRLRAAGHGVEVKNVRDEPWINEPWNKRKEMRLN
jgi:hypothetical protein